MCDTMSIIINPLLVCLFGYTLLGNSVYGLRCYVCEYEKNNSMSCDNFDPRNENFTKECPPDKSAACLASLSNGKVTFRDCESFNINDCSRANNIEYCYCSEDLCNGRWLPSGDDEDDSFEGSGRFSTPITASTTTTVPIVTVSITTQIPRSVARCLNVAIQYFLLVFAAQYFIQQYYY